MTARLRRHKGIIILAIIVVLVLFGWLYREFHPTIVFHSPQESKYLGKVSGTDGSIEKLYIKDHTVKYRLPYIWEWQEDDEVAIFINNYGDVIHKEDLCFWKLESGRKQLPPKPTHDRILLWFTSYFAVPNG